MIMTKSSRASMIDLIRTRSSLLSKTYVSGQQERFAPMNQLLLSRMTKYLWHLTIVLIFLAPLASANLSYAAGRVFYDDFEDGTTNKWAQDEFRNKCTVVTSATDRVTGPHAGSRMVRCNWNGSAAWNDSAAFESLRINSINYNNELFYRVWMRPDTNLQRTSNSPTKILRIYNQAVNDLYHVLWTGNSLRSEGVAGGSSFPTYWGSGNDNSGLSSGWHKIEFYFNHSTGTIREWHDGLMIRNNAGLSFGSTKWYPLFITSNWSDSHDSTNHVYFDGVEIYSDTGTGSSGLMSDATINSSSSSQTVPNRPENAQVIVIP